MDEYPSGGKESPLEHVTVVLLRPRLPENIGATARAMWNMGLSRLVVVDPLRWDERVMMRLATRRAQGLIHALEVRPSLESALGSFEFVVGTSGRERGLRKADWAPRQAANEILALARGNRVALLFGPEDRGLTNHELRLCHALVRIPTAQFASLNVAQAVMVLCYELHLANAVPERPPEPPVLASTEDLEVMYSRLQDTLTRIGMIHPSQADSGMMKVRQVLSRIRLRAREAKMILGLCRQIEWYARSRAKENSAGPQVNAAEPDRHA